MDEYKLLHDFGRNLNGLLDDSFMSQKELSEATGINESTISRYIAGNCMPTLKNVVSIMIALECEFYELVDM